MASTGEALTGLWRFEAPHPEWTEEDGGEDGWEQVVAWWAVQTSDGLLLIDPLIGSDWSELDGLVKAGGGCAGVVRTIHWHQRSVAEAATRYGASVMAMRVADVSPPPPDRTLSDGDEICDGITAFATERQDEIALWLPEQSALLFADAMLRTESGTLHRCPDSWTQPHGGQARARAILEQLARLPASHVLVSHGPLILGDGPSALRAAIAA